jgi:uncharacterized protein Yka (UPF0111/DUF47 family)
MQEPQKELAERIAKIESEADEVRRILIDELNRTFVTPSTGRTSLPYR